jgi:16S rRNA (guanine(966)-N(2))-methyltransferase RsmD
MRVIGGTAKGRRLEAPRGRRVRPTLDRVREALFDILSSDVPGTRFLDLFAGTGANGIEALSRGAEQATFVDADTTVLAVLRRNLQHTGFADRARCLRLTLPTGLRDFGRAHGSFGIVFMDPPREFSEIGAMLDSIRRQGIVCPEGVLVAEHDSRTPVGEREGWHRARRAVYGETALSFFRPLTE